MEISLLHWNELKLFHPVWILKHFLDFLAALWIVLQPLEWCLWVRLQQKWKIPTGVRVQMQLLPNQTPVFVIWIDEWQDVMPIWFFFWNINHMVCMINFLWVVKFSKNCLHPLCSLTNKVPLSAHFYGPTNFVYFRPFWDSCMLLWKQKVILSFKKHIFYICT